MNEHRIDWFGVALFALIVGACLVAWLREPVKTPLPDGVRIVKIEKTCPNPNCDCHPTPLAPPVILKVEPKPLVPQLVVYTADWCHWCRQAEPALEALERKGIRVVRINIDRVQTGVRSIPLFVIRPGTPDEQRTQDINVVQNAFP